MDLPHKRFTVWQKFLIILSHWTVIQFSNIFSVFIHQFTRLLPVGIAWEPSLFAFRGWKLWSHIVKAKELRRGSKKSCAFLIDCKWSHGCVSYALEMCSVLWLIGFWIWLQIQIQNQTKHCTSLLCTCKIMWPLTVNWNTIPNSLFIITAQLHSALSCKELCTCASIIWSLFLPSGSEHWRSLLHSYKQSIYIYYTLSLYSKKLYLLLGYTMF